MAQPTNTFATNDMVGIREDLSDVIYDVSPTETPFLSMVAHVEATATYHEWQVHSLTAASATNHVIEGDDATTDAGTATVRRGNYTNISDKVARVTGTAQSVTAAGRANEMDFQVMNRSKELKRDMESLLLANNARVAGNDTTARELAGLPTWLFTNTDFGATGANPTGDGSNARTDGTQRAFTEDQLKTVLQSAWTEGGNVSVLMTGGFNRQVASSFSGGGTKTQKAEDSKLHATFDVYVSDFGSLKMSPNRYCRTRDALVLDPDLWAVAFLPGRNMVTTELAKTGDTDRKQVLSEYTLEARNEKGNAGVYDLTTS
jgi:hypothetical protein